MWNNNRAFSFVLRCSYLWCRLRRFDCMLILFIRWWGRLVTRHLLSRMLRCYWLFFSSCDWCISILAVSVCCSLGGALSYGSNMLLCFLIAGVHASAISIPLSLLMLLGWSLMSIVTLTPLVYQWGSRSTNFLRSNRVVSSLPHSHF